MLSARIKPLWSHDYTLLILGCWLLLLRSSDAFVIQTASATRTCQNLGLAYHLIPHATPAPVPHGELRARQASSTSLATCGYINGDGGRSTIHAKRTGPLTTLRSRCNLRSKSILCYNINIRGLLRKNELFRHFHDLLRPTRGSMRLSLPKQPTEPGLVSLRERVSPVT